MAIRGILYIVSAPSGAGKTSLVKQLLSQNSNIKLSISYTTRAPRKGEQEGKDYYFVDLEHFNRLKQEGRFLETAEVFGNWYGTSKDWLETQLSLGLDILLEIDWQGARQIRELFDCVSVYILPPTKTALLTRLKARGQDTLEVIEKRMQEATYEMIHYSEYDYIVVNDDFETALGDLLAIIRVGHHSIAFQREHYAELMSKLMT